MLRATAILAATRALSAVLVSPAPWLLAAVLRANAVSAAALPVWAFFVRHADPAVVLVFVDAQALEAGAFIRTAVVRIAARQNVVDAALDLAAISCAADRPLRTFVVAAALRTGTFERTISTTHQAIATVLLVTPTGVQDGAVDHVSAILPKLHAGIGLGCGRCRG